MIQSVRKSEIDSMATQQGKIFNVDYASNLGSSLSFHKSVPTSPLQALADARFSNLFLRAESNRNQVSPSQVTSERWAHPKRSASLGSTDCSSTTNIKNDTGDKKTCLTPTWKNRLQGLLVGLAIAAVMTGTALAITLTRPWVTTTTTVASTASPCSSMQWDSVGIVVAGNGSWGSAPNQLANPQGVYVDSNNSIYITDNSNQRIQRWLPNAVNGTTVAGISRVCMSNASGLCWPNTITVDALQNMYIGDNYGIRLWPLGSSSSTFLNTSTSWPYINGLFLDKNQNLYASLPNSEAIMMWSPSNIVGVIVAGGNGWGYSSSQLVNPCGLTVDSTTNTIYVANTNAQTVVAWQINATSGSIVAGQNSTVGAATNMLRSPSDVKRDSSGNLYILDAGNYRVLLSCASLSDSSPRSILDFGPINSRYMALDSNINIYLSDSNNNRILKYNRIA